ncbi:MAG: hypothetical protein WBC06_01320, partial [Chitinophagaceae bacterium]
MKALLKEKYFVAVLFSLTIGSAINAQICEWRLNNAIYSTTDPDGAGPAVGSVTFTLQIHTTAGSIPNVNVIATGWNWQSANAMIPTTPGCAIVSNPANVSVGSAFITGGFSYTTVFQCGLFSQTLGGENFDRRAVGTLDGTGITLTTTWVDVFTVTLWSLNATAPFAGFTTINSSSGGSPAEFTTYSVSDVDANEFPVNSLTTATPLALASAAVLPVTFTNYHVNCTDKGASLTWSTASEQNSSKFEIQRSVNSTDWITIDNVAAAGNSDVQRNYQYLDLNSGTAFYRIRQVDNDGRFVYTAVKRTDCKTSQFDITLYPVPAKDNLNVVIKAEKALKTDLQILDVNGRIVQRINTQINKGNN